MKSCCPSLLSRTSDRSARPFRFIFVLFLGLIAFGTALGQAQPEQLEMSRFVIFSGVGLQGSTVPTGPGYGVQLGSSANINGGSVGSLKLVKTTGNVNITGNIFSKGTIVLANGAKVTGRLAASNLPTISGTILNAGSNANFGGNIDVNGNIVIGGGIVAGKVTHPEFTTYVGPAPGLGEFTLPPTLPDYPSLPPISDFVNYNSSATDITKTTAIDPVPHNSIKLSGNQTLTFKGPGTYTLNSIDNKNGNTFVFDFKNQAGDIYLHVHNNVNLAKLDVSIIGGGNASRVFMEVHGKGAGSDKNAFELPNGAPGGTKTRWSGTVWAPYAAINVGSGTGSSEITGALWSGTQVIIQTGVNINYLAFGNCTAPTLSVVDATVCSTENGGNTSVINLNNYVTTSGGTVSFSSGGSSIANPSSYTATSGEVITVTASNSATCSKTASFNVVVNDKQSFGICAPLQGKTNDLIGSELTSLSDIYNAGGTVSSSEVFFILGDKVAISIVYYPAGLSQLLSLLPTLGMTDIVVNDDGTFIITGFFPIANLPQLNSRGDLINLVYPSFPAVVNSGLTTTQGDKALRSDLVKLGYDIGGAGVKIGVLSDSYSTLPNSDVSNGELPGETNPFGYTTKDDLVRE
jgi:hypothetical protein